MSGWRILDIICLNVKLEYQHGKAVRDMLKTEIREEWEELCRVDKRILED